MFPFLQVLSLPDKPKEFIAFCEGSMGRLKRQVIVLGLCLVAVLTARFYVNRFLDEQRRTGGDAAPFAETPAAAEPVGPARPDRRHRYQETRARAAQEPMSGSTSAR